MNRLFYVDGHSGRCVSYAELMRMVAAVEHPPQVLAWEEDVSFFAQLLAAMRNGATVVLTDGPADVNNIFQASAPQAMSVEHSGQGSQEIGLRGIESGSLSNLPEASVYGSQGENAPEASAYGSQGEDAPEASAYGSRETKGERENAPEASACGRLEEKRTGSEVFSFKENGGRVGLFTSGTTGKPKMVLHSVQSLTRGVRCDPKHADDVWGLAYHPAHMAGLQVFFQAVANHNTLVRLFGASVEESHLAIEQQRITHLSATPTLLNLMCSTGHVHQHVKSVTSGGELSSEALRGRLSATFPHARLHNVYASTELGSLLVSHDDAFRVPDRLQGQVRVLDGELVVHRSLLAASLQQQLDGEFYATGDCAEVLQADPLTFRITSRQGDWINVGGYKVNPHRLEALLLTMDEVVEAAVYGRENSVTGSLVCCDVVLLPGSTLTAREVHTRLSHHVPAYMIPRIVRSVDSIASTSTGKKQRTQ